MGSGGERHAGAFGPALDSLDVGRLAVPLLLGVRVDVASAAAAWPGATAAGGLASSTVTLLIRIFLVLLFYLGRWLN